MNTNKLTLKIINFFKTISILSFVLCSSSKTVLFAYQQQTGDDSSKIKSERVYLSHDLKVLINNRLFLGQSSYNVPLDEPMKLSFYEPENNRRSLLQLKTELKNYIIARRNFLPNYDLGEFGKYLAYANTLAVILLAISHVSKYGFR
ncbi:MAG: hypothetical protein U5K00_04265 [Melioribacteraceae bacterium]|nr:hypothetical protein [Melioribacteraceae bacterium]